MAPHAEATIAAEFIKFVMNGALYQGSKPVMWSPVEKTALAEAEVEYENHKSHTIWVAFPFASTPICDRFRGRFENRTGGYLDDDPLDYSLKPRRCV